jgi:hypothetical protein
LRYTEAFFWHTVSFNEPLGELADGHFVKKFFSLQLNAKFYYYIHRIPLQDLVIWLFNPLDALARRLR